MCIFVCLCFAAPCCRNRRCWRRLWGRGAASRPDLHSTAADSSPLPLLSSGSWHTHAHAHMHTHTQKETHINSDSGAVCGFPHWVASNLPGYSKEGSWSSNRNLQLLLMESCHEKTAQQQQRNPTMHFHTINLQPHASLSEAKCPRLACTHRFPTALQSCLRHVVQFSASGSTPGLEVSTQQFWSFVFGK